jgi:murein DD-endopeptidase MepM/ murein hydrolase activator NlpD
METEPKKARHSRQEQKDLIRERKSHRTLIAVVVAFVLLIALSAFAFLLLREQPTSKNIDDVVLDMGSTGEQAAQPTELELARLAAIEAGGNPSDPNLLYLPTPLIAEYPGIQLHSPISANNITEVEFHQASYNTALRLTPLLPIVDAEEVAEKHGTKHTPADEQPTGDKPLIGEAVSTWRLDSVGDEMTSVDVGALAGTDVYAPISGTVVKIKTYSLYGLIDDFEVHIQTPDHPEFDIVLLHVEDLSVKVGDKVIGGCTRIAKVRNIGDIIDNNLANFTVPDDPGNHCHVQVNDATREDYKGLEDALDIYK